MSKSRTLNKRAWRTPVRSVCATLALSTVALVGLASPAQAHASDTFTLDSARVDVGFGPTFNSQPQPSAAVTWNHSGNQVSPRVYGYLAMVNADGFCGRIRLRYWDGNTLVDHEHSYTLCPTNNDYTGVPTFTGTFTGDITRVEVSAMQRFQNGPWQSQASVNLYP